MAQKRTFQDYEADDDPKKKSKTGEIIREDKQQERDPKRNPYLAHMYNSEDEEDGGVGLNGFASNGQAFNNTYHSYTRGKSLDSFTRHRTTSAQASKAEDGPENPFTGNPLSEKYFGILKTRRNLPVHVQRYVMVHVRITGLICL